jgi:hypothetical protein
MHRLAEWISWDRLLGFLNVYKLRARIFKLLRSPGIDSACLCSLAGRYDNPIHTRFPSPMDCSKIPAQTPLSCGLVIRLQVVRPQEVWSSIYHSIPYVAAPPSVEHLQQIHPQNILPIFKRLTADYSHPNSYNFGNFPKHFSFA